MKHPRILVLRGGAIGDFICTLPALGALRDRWPDSYIELLGYPHIACLAVEACIVDRVFSLDQAEVAEYFSMHPRLGKSQTEKIRSFDIVISYLYDPYGTVRENMLAAGARQFIYGSPIVAEEHAVNHLFGPLAELALFPADVEIPALTIGSEGKAEAERRIGRYGESVVAIHPGSGSPEKNWPLENFMSLADRVLDEGLGQPVLIAGEADEQIVRDLTERQSDVPIIRGYRLLDIARILGACSGYVGNDSGITQIACALGVPAVVLYGPTDPGLWGPRGSNAAIVAAADRTTQALATVGVDEVYARLREKMTAARK